MARSRYQVSGWIRKAKRLAIYRRDRCRCVYCGRKVVVGAKGRTDAATLDHVTPRELGGSNEASNLVTCCLSCNSSKQSKPLRQFLADLAAQGVDAASIRRRIRNCTRRVLRRAA